MLSFLRSPLFPRMRLVAAIAFAAITALFLAVYARAFAGLDPMMIDSESYLFFSPDRTIGYQVLLAMLGRFSTDLHTVVVAQLLLVGLGMWVATVALLRTTGSVLAALAFLVLGFGYPAPMKYVVLVMTEGPSMALAALLGALILVFVRKPKRRTALAFALLVAVGVTIRPTNAGFVVGAAIAIGFLADRARRGRWIALVVAAFVIGYAASPLAYRVLAPGRTPDNPAVRGLFGRAMLAPGSDAARARACGMASLDPVTQPVKRYLAGTPGELRPFLQERYLDYLRFYVVLPRLMREHGWTAPGQATPLLKCYVAGALREHPGYFAGQAAGAYWGILSYRNYDWPGFSTRLTAFEALAPMPLSPGSGIEVPPPTIQGLRPTAAWRLSAAQPRPAFGSDDLFTPPQPRNVWLVRMLGAVLVASAAITLACLAALPFARLRTPTVVGIAAAGSVVHAILVVSALIEVPIPRYFYPLWPLIVLVLVWAGHALAMRLAGLLSPRMR